MNDISIRDDETLEDLQLNQFRLIQKKNGFRFGMDSVLLADFASVRPDDLVADFGTGTGILPLLLIGRGKGKHFYCYEIQSCMAEMAERTMQMNGLCDRVEIRARDAGDAWEELEKCSIDAVICNPPYGQPGKCLHNQTDLKAISRHQQKDTLSRFFQSAFRILKGKGKIDLVYPASQMLSVLTLLQSAHLEPKKIRLVYPSPAKAAYLLLIEAVKDARPLLHHMPPLIVCNRDGDLTNELKSVYHMTEQNPV